MSAFNGVKAFCATMVRQREELGEQVTRWLEHAHATIPGFTIVDIVVKQSSDEAFHCTSIIVFYNEALEPKAPKEPKEPKEKRRG